MTPLIETVWPAGESGIICGAPEVGKTWYAFEEAICLAMGWTVLQHFAVTERKRVLFFEEEAETAPSARNRVDGILRSHGVLDNPSIRQELTEWFTLVAFPGIRLCDPNDIDRIADTVEATNAEVIYLDSFFRMMPGKELGASGAVTQALGHLDDLARHYRVRFRVLHHLTKDSHSLYGSQALAAWRRDGLRFDELAGGFTTVRYEGNNAAKAPLGQIRLEFADKGNLASISLVPLGQDRSRLNDRDNDVLLLLRAKPEGSTVAELINGTTISRESARDSLKRLRQHGLAEPCGAAKAGKTTARRWRALPMVKAAVPVEESEAA